MSTTLQENKRSFYAQFNNELKNLANEHALRSTLFLAAAAFFILNVLDESNFLMVYERLGIDVNTELNLKVISIIAMYTLAISELIYLLQNVAKQVDKQQATAPDNIEITSFIEVSQTAPVADINLPHKRSKNKNSRRRRK